MDFGSLILFIGVPLYLALCFWDIYRTNNPKSSATKPLKKVPADNSWEKEWLDTLRKQHHVRSIEQTKLVFKFAKEPMEDRKQLDGFKVYCSCGQGEIIGLDLRMAKSNYSRHLEKEGERALAEIGKFEMPKGINWRLEAEKE